MEKSKTWCCLGRKYPESNCLLQRKCDDWSDAGEDIYLYPVGFGPLLVQFLHGTASHLRTKATTPKCSLDVPPRNQFTALQRHHTQDTQAGKETRSRLSLGVHALHPVEHAVQKLGPCTTKSCVLVLSITSFSPPLSPLSTKKQALDLGLCPFAACHLLLASISSGSLHVGLQQQTRRVSLTVSHEPCPVRTFLPGLAFEQCRDCLPAPRHCPASL